MEKFSTLAERGIVGINQDLNDPIRQEFDRAVLNAFGIGYYHDRIVDSLKTMRRIRKAVKQQTIQQPPHQILYDKNPQFDQIMERAAETRREM